MFEKFTRSARIGASYAGVLGDLVGLEARLEVRRISERLRQRVIALVLVLLGLVWLHVGAFVLIWDSPYRHLIPFGVAAGLLLIAGLVWASSNLSRKAPLFEASRASLAADAELWGIDLTPEHVLRDLPGDPLSATSAGADTTASPSRHAGLMAGTTEQAEAQIEVLQAQLQALRRGLRRSVVGDPPPLNRQPAGDGASGFAAAGEGSGPSGRATGAPGFSPKSRTMRTVMQLVGNGRGDGLIQQLPIRALAAVAVSGVLRGRTRWLISLWPILRVISAQMARSRRAARPPPVDVAGDGSVGVSPRTDVGNDDISVVRGPMSTRAGDS